MVLETGREDGREIDMPGMTEIGIGVEVVVDSGMIGIIGIGTGTGITEEIGIGTEEELAEDMNGNAVHTGVVHQAEEEAADTLLHLLMGDTGIMEAVEEDMGGIDLDPRQEDTVPHEEGVAELVIEADTITTVVKEVSSSIILAEGLLLQMRPVRLQPEEVLVVAHRMSNDPNQCLGRDLGQDPGRSAQGPVHAPGLGPGRDHTLPAQLRPRNAVDPLRIRDQGLGRGLADLLTLLDLDQGRQLKARTRRARLSHPQREERRTLGLEVPRREAVGEAARAGAGVQRGRTGSKVQTNRSSTEQRLRLIALWTCKSHLCISWKSDFGRA